uniref:hypothetical protein n=1 Tax=Pseudomonas viridiflava TaxID=33069 RepID=UPI00197E810D
GWILLQDNSSVQQRTPINGISLRLLPYKAWQQDFISMNACSEFSATGFLLDSERIVSFFHAHGASFNNDETTLDEPM